MPARRKTAHPAPAWHKLALAALVLAAFAAAWRYTPLAEYVTAERVSAWASLLADAPWAPFAVILVYTPAAFVMFPRPLITLAAVIAFGPLIGCVCALAGILLAAFATYYGGRALPRRKVRQLAGKRLDAVSEVLRRRGLVAVLAVRIVPVAPFVVIGLVAGALRIRVRDFAIGTLLGVLPGTLATTVFGNQLQAALEDPSRINYWLVAAVLLVFGALTLLMRRWFASEQRAAPQH